MNSTLDSFLDSTSQPKPCDSHVSVYYEQEQKQDEEEIFEQQYDDSCNNDNKSTQSPPVEIHEENTRSIDLPPMTWHGYHMCPKMLNITNTGRTILINGLWANSRPYIEGGPLNGNYIFSQIHFHCPSEHEIDGRRYPLEMHVVHYKTSYLTQERAMDEKDGTVVLVYLFKLMKTGETVLSQITKLAPLLEKANSWTETNEIALDQLIKPFSSNYYVYWGSVTTKKKSYLLQWIISCSYLSVTQKEVEELSNIIMCAGLSNDKPITRVKPDNDAVFHVGEEDYSLPPLRTCVVSDICNICKCHEVSYIPCTCQVKKNKKKDSGKKKSGKSPEECEPRKSKKKNQIKICSDILTDEAAFSCESGNESSRSHLSDEKNKKEKKKKKKKKKQSDCCDSREASDDDESGKTSSKSCTSENESRKKRSKSSDKSSLSASESEGKKPNKKKKKGVSENKNFCYNVETEDEATVKEKQKKKKNKKEVNVVKSIQSLDKVSANQKTKASSDLCGLQLHSSGLFSHSSRSSFTEDETKAKAKSERLSNCAEGNETPDPAHVEVECDAEESKEIKEIKVAHATTLHPSKSRSASPTNLKEKSKEEARNSKNTANAQSKARAARSKSSVKKKVSIKKENEGGDSANAKSKISLFKASQTKVGKNKKGAEGSASQSVQDLKHAKATAGAAKGKRDSKSPGDKKASNNKLAARKTSKPLIPSSSKEKAKEEKKASTGQDKTQDCNDEITTIFEKKKGGKKKEPVGGDGNDVQINFLLTPSSNCVSNPSYGLMTSESDFTDEKKAGESGEKHTDCSVGNFSVNTVTTPVTKFPEREPKKESEVCLLMKHLIRTENKEGQMSKCTSQEYHVAVMCDQEIMQEYKGKFHTDELNDGKFKILELIPNHTETPNSNFQLQDCIVKRESSDQICIKTKFLLKEINIRQLFGTTKNEPTEQKKPESVLHKETQCSYKNFDLAKKSETKISREKSIDRRKTEIISKECKIKPEEEQKKNMKSNISQGGKDTTESQKCTMRLQKNPVIDSPQISECLDTKEDPNDSKGGKNKTEKPNVDKNDKKLKPLYVKRRKTVYFMYDKVEKDEVSGKKIFVGTFRTQEEVDFLKKQKRLLQESGSVQSSIKSEKSKDTCDSKFLLSLANKDVDVEILKTQESSNTKEKNSPEKKVISPSKDSSDKNDIVTLHKYKPKYTGSSVKKDSKNIIIGKVISSLQKESENFKNFVEAADTEKEKEPKISIYELQEVPEAETQKQTPMPTAGTEENGSQKRKAEAEVQAEQSKAEEAEAEKPGMAESSSAGKTHKAFESNDSQALILIPVEVESLSKIEVILIEHLNSLKKNKKENE